MLMEKTQDSNRSVSGSSESVQLIEMVLKGGAFCSFYSFRYLLIF